MILDQLLAALSPYLILVCLAGTTLGILWGAMPGLSTTMAMALLIGLSTGMSQNVAIMFILGVFTGSVFGGAISAVLINIPGTPDSVPTMIEGYPLAKRGEGGLALGTAIAASFLGNWVGILLLIAFIPLLLKLALSFQSLEMFLLAMWGIAISGTMSSGKRPVKGWISGWIGLVVSFVGLDAIHGAPRFTFGFDRLEDGISYIPVLIGLFGLAEILRVLPKKSPTGIPAEVGRVVPPFSMLWKHSPCGAALRAHRHDRRRHSRRGGERGRVPRVRHRPAARIPRGAGQVGQGQLRRHRLCGGREQREHRRLDAANAHARHSRAVPPPRRFLPRSS